jgi:hypothetical protein
MNTTLQQKEEEENKRFRYGNQNLVVATQTTINTWSPNSPKMMPSNLVLATQTTVNTWSPSSPKAMPSRRK